MKTIWKFDIPIQDDFSLLIPKGAEILNVDLQNGEPKLWALVDSEAPQEEHHFVGKGENNVNLRYIGTVVMLEGKFVYHVFEVE